MKRITTIVVLVLCCVSCGSTLAQMPPNLSPVAQSAWRNTRTQRVLDLVRDTATDANAQKPPLMSDAATRKVVEWHKAAITALHATSGVGSISSTIADSVTSLKAGLAASDVTLLSPYFNLLTEALK